MRISKFEHRAFKISCDGHWNIQEHPGGGKWKRTAVTRDGGMCVSTAFNGVGDDMDGQRRQSLSPNLLRNIIEPGIS